jgi:hypothetical protein
MSVSYILVFLITIFIVILIIRHFEAKDAIESKNNIELELEKLRTEDIENSIDEESFSEFQKIKLNYELARYFASMISEAIHYNEHIDFKKLVDSKREYKKRKDICTASLRNISNDWLHAIASDNIISFLLIAGETTEASNLFKQIRDPQGVESVTKEFHFYVNIFKRQKD